MVLSKSQVATDVNISLATRTILHTLRLLPFCMSFSSLCLRRRAALLSFCTRTCVYRSDHIPTPLPFQRRNGCWACRAPSIMNPFCNKFCLIAILMLPYQPTLPEDEIEESHPGLL